MNFTEKNLFSLVLNPFTDATVFQFENPTSSTLIVSDVPDKTIRLEKINGEVFIFKREDLKAGIYFFSIIENGIRKSNGRLLIVE